MRADLVTREPQRLEKWQKDNLYKQIQAARAGAEKFILHDGPPFANGDVHIGTASNKILKDFIVKYKTLRGYSAPYVPGWDCHGLPIEFKVSQEMRQQRPARVRPAEPMDPARETGPSGKPGEVSSPSTADRSASERTIPFDPVAIRKACEDY